MNTNKNTSNTYILVPKNKNNFICKKCDYHTSRKGQYERHLLTLKHKKIENTYLERSERSVYKCKCGKSYKHSQSLYNHKKKCHYKESQECDYKECEECDNKIINNDSLELKTMLLQVMKENKELQKTIITLVPQIGNNNNNINTTNNVKQNLILMSF